MMRIPRPTPERGRKGNPASSSSSSSSSDSKPCNQTVGIKFRDETSSSSSSASRGESWSRDLCSINLSLCGREENVSKHILPEYHKACTFRFPSKTCTFFLIFSFSCSHSFLDILRQPSARESRQTVSHKTSLACKHPILSFLVVPIPPELRE